VALLDHLGIDQVALIGHSMGGQMATRFARLYPERTTHLIMVNPIGLGGAERAAPMEPVTREMIPQAPEPGPVSTDRQQVYDRHLATETRRVVDWKPEFLEHVRIRFGNDISTGGTLLAAVRTANQTGDSMVGDWPLIQAPALAIGGEDDGPNFPDQMRRAAEMLPKGEVLLFPNVGHNPHVEAPELLNREILRFLESR
jgi:pimeloyl-ACP methyl ester carboxylesterase